MASNPAFGFDGKNESAQRMVDSYDRNYTWRITSETRASIAAIIRRSIADGLSPIEAAKLIRGTIGLNRPQALAVANYRKSLVASGLPSDRVATLVNRYSDRQLSIRADMIARTEIMGALNAGALEGWKQAREKGYLTVNATKTWLTTYDELTEALTAIDINTGSYVGSRNLEETILKTNLEAVKEIAYQ